MLITSNHHWELALGNTTPGATEQQIGEISFPRARLSILRFSLYYSKRS